MAESSTELSAAKLQSLPQRDWVVLPLISLLTIGLMMGTAEWVARWMFQGPKTGNENCMVLNDPTTGARGIPNSVCWEKPAEGDWIEYRYNRHGHRAGTELGPKAAGTYRIVLIGSSVALGYNVPREKSFAALLPEELTRRAGRAVEVYNEAMGFGFAHRTALHFKEALAAQPDLILWILTPLDISRGAAVDVLRGAVVGAQGIGDPGAGFGFPENVWRRLKFAVASDSIEGATADLFNYSKTAYMFRHFLYESHIETVKSVLREFDSDGGYLRSELSAAWQSLLRRFETDAADIEWQATSARIPLVATLLPERGQAAILSAAEWPDGFDPYKLDKELRSIVVRHGGSYIDILPGFRGLPQAEHLYFPMDGHPNAAGHAVFSSLLAKELTSGKIAGLLAANPTQALDRRN
jgi:hypothetical protein